MTKHLTATELLDLARSRDWGVFTFPHPHKRDYRLFYDTAYQRDCSKRIWEEKPEGLMRAHLGHRFETTDSGTLVVPVVAICQRGGRMVKEIHRVYLTAATAKKRSPRLRRVVVTE